MLDVREIILIPDKLMKNIVSKSPVGIPDRNSRPIQIGFGFTYLIYTFNVTTQ